MVDGDTIFTALIMQQQSLPGVEAYPRPVMQYTEDLYRSVFGSHGAFWLRENGALAVWLLSGCCRLHRRIFCLTLVVACCLGLVCNVCVP